MIQLFFPYRYYYFALWWYGLLVMLGIRVSVWFSEREVRRRGGKGQTLWDALIWVLRAGIIQELYGQATTLPWFIPLDAAHRMGVYKALVQYALATTRFHPTFALLTKSCRVSGIVCPFAVDWTRKGLACGQDFIATW